MLVRKCDRCGKPVGANDKSKGYWTFECRHYNAGGGYSNIDRAPDLCETCYTLFENFLNEVEK